MKAVKDWLLTAVDALLAVKDENLRWQEDNLAKQARLKRARLLADQTLADELKKQALQLEHDLARLKTRHHAELAMLKAKYRQDVKDYRQYLAALDKLKASIQSRYVQLPEAVAFTIHHHAKHLLDTMWATHEVEEKMRCELRLIAFMTAVHEDACLHLEQGGQPQWPEKTLGLLQQADAIGR